MNKAEFNEYLEKRYYDQLNYYEKASGKNQKKYKNFQWILIIFSTTTTILAAFPPDDFKNLNYLIVATSALVTILTAGLKTFQYQELWVSYRSTIEQLKPEIYYYQFKIDSYGVKGIDCESEFVSRVESILRKERNSWPVSKKIKEQDNADQEALDEIQNKLDVKLRERFNTQKENQPIITSDVSQNEEIKEEPKIADSKESVLEESDNDQVQNTSQEEPSSSTNEGDENKKNELNSNEQK